MRPHIEEQLLANPIENIDDLDKFCNWDLMVCALKKMAEKKEITILWMPNLGYDACLTYSADQCDPARYNPELEKAYMEGDHDKYRELEAKCKTVEEVDARPFQIYTAYNFPKFLHRFVYWMSVASEEQGEKSAQEYFEINQYQPEFDFRHKGEARLAYERGYAHQDITLSELSIMIEWAEVTVGNNGTFISLPTFGYEDSVARGGWNDEGHWCHTWKNGRFEKPQE